MGPVCVFAVLLFASLSLGVFSRPIYNVKDYGAKGDGKTDDAQAFMDTWTAACADFKAPLFYVPSGTFPVYELYFMGPCNSYVSVQVDGTILSHYQIRVMRNNQWISFLNINGLRIWGTGKIDGQGAVWYDCRARKQCTNGPTAFAIRNCTRVNLSGLHFKNSPMIHINIQKSSVVYVSGITITAPEDSPNTDGIHIGRSRHVKIRNSIIGTGDDCISIENGSFNVNISDVTCGPGHGISIGSLGEDQSGAEVERIHVSHCKFIGTTNGVRIKTCQGGRGYVKGVSFEHMNFTSVRNPIIIDQYYGGGPNMSSAVEVSNVNYVDLVGSSATDDAIVLKCSKSHACRNIGISNVRLESATPGKNITTTCFNAHVTETDPIIPALSCSMQR